MDVPRSERFLYRQNYALHYQRILHANSSLGLPPRRSLTSHPLQIPPPTIATPSLSPEHSKAKHSRIPLPSSPINEPHHLPKQQPEHSQQSSQSSSPKPQLLSPNLAQPSDLPSVLPSSSSEAPKDSKPPIIEKLPSLPKVSVSPQQAPHIFTWKQYRKISAISHKAQSDSIKKQAHLLKMVSIPNRAVSKQTSSLIPNKSTDISKGTSPSKHSAFSRNIPSAILLGPSSSNRHMLNLHFEPKRALSSINTHTESTSPPRNKKQRNLPVNQSRQLPRIKLEKLTQKNALRPMLSEQSSILLSKQNIKPLNEQRISSKPNSPRSPHSPRSNSALNCLDSNPEQYPPNRYKSRISSPIRRYEIESSNKSLTDRLISIALSPRSLLHRFDSYSRYHRFERSFRERIPHREAQKRSLEQSHHMFQSRVAQVKARVGSIEEWRQNSSRVETWKRNISRYPSQQSLHSASSKSLEPEHVDHIPHEHLSFDTPQHK